MLSPTPGSAAVTNLLYGTQASTIQSPAVSLVSGSAGSSTISSVAPIAATVTATAGLTFYESANAPTVAPAVDGFARTGMPDLVQSTFKACASGTSCSQTFTSNVLSKDIVVVSIEWVGAVTAIAISDGQASARCSFTAVSGSPVSHTSETAMWYCTTTTAGPMTPTVSWTTARVSKLDIYEIVGYATAGLTCNTGTGSGSTSPAVASTAFSGTPFLVASYSMSTAVTVTAGAGFTRSDTSTAGDGGSGEYAAFGIASPTTFPATKSGTSAWAGIGCEFPESTLASVSLRLTTTGTSDLIYVAVCILNSGSQTVSAVTDSSSLSYSRRQFVALGTNVRIESWYATSTSALSADLITVSLSGAAEFVVVAMGVSGTNTASPFDPNLASPPTGTGTSATASTAITTAFPDDLIIGAVVAQSHPALTAGAGFTLVASRADASGTVSGGVEGQSVTTTQAGSTVSFTLGSSQNWAILADAVVAGQATPSADTSVSQPPSPGSFTIPVGSSAFLWSPAYSVPGTFYSGSWLLDLWASKATSSGTLTASIFLVSSNGAIAATVLSSGTTGSIPTSETEVKTTFAGSTAGIPAGGRVLVVLTNPSPVGATAATVYWGTSQLTNFQSPSTYSYVLTVSNGASASWTIGLATVGSMTSNLGRLTNLTVWLSSPTNVVTKEIVVTSGALTQASGATVTLAGSGTYSIGVAAYSAALPTSSNTPSTVTFSLRVKPTASTAFSQYTISLAVN
jgi:hypothetical protein